MPATNDLPPNALISVWENGFGKSSTERAKDLIEIWMPDFQEDPLSLEHLSIEMREQFLLDIRKKLFGRNFFSIARCPACDEMIQWEMQYSDFSSEAGMHERKVEFDFESQGYRILYRLPRENDLEGGERIEILKKCVLKIKKGDQQVNPDEVSTSLWEALEDQIEAKSPLSSSMINLSCPECDHQWSLHFSVIEFLWTELDQWAHRFLNDISILALNYGWSEQELMQMNPVRRSYYLKMLTT